MTRAPSTLPFSLQPNPSPEQLANQQIYIQQQNPIININSRLSQQKRFFSNICRTGPLPISKHTIKDPFCLIIYIIFLIATIVLFCINYFSHIVKNATDFQQLNFFEKLVDSFNQTIPEIMLSCVSIIVVGLLLLFLVIAIPTMAGYLILLCLVCLLGFIMYSLIGSNWGDIFYVISSKKSKHTQTNNAFKISMIVLTSIAAIAVIFLIIRRYKKLKHLGAMMRVVKAILMENLPALPLIFTFILPLINMGVWCAFIKMLWKCIKIYQSGSTPIPSALVISFIILLWIWSHGFMIAVSDYICQSWVLHWYFNSKNQQQKTQTLLKQNWKTLIFKKLFKYHLGTCIYASFNSIFLIDFIVLIIQRYQKNKKTQSIKKQSFTYSLICLSRYFDVETIMQNLNYCTANKQMYQFRKRIKQKMPQIYMLGHFLQQTMKVMLPLLGLYLWFIYTYNLAGFLHEYVLDFSPFLFMVFGLSIALSIFRQVSINIAHLFGMLSDTAVMAYSIDCEIQRVHFDQNMANSVPQKLKQAFIKLEIGISVQTSKIEQEYGFDNIKDKSQIVHYQPNNSIYH